jgi:hypothetical protein
LTCQGKTYNNNRVAKATKPKQIVASVFCPLSGVQLTDGFVKSHKIPLVICVNGTLTGVCSTHGVRLFITGPDVIVKLKNMSEPGGMFNGQEKEKRIPGSNRLGGS